MPALYAYTNVESTSVAILRRKGFQVWYDKGQDMFWAEKGGWDFCASGATELLGAVAIYEETKPRDCSEYWWKAPDAVPTKDLPSKPKRYVSIVDRKKR